MSEVWKDIPGYEGHYQVSNLGRIKSLKGNKIKILKSVSMKIGYTSVGLSLNGEVKLHYVHRLVAGLFIDKPKGKTVVNHLDGIKNNNQSSNLEWVTKAENEIHAYENGLISVGNNHPNAKLTESQVIRIRKMKSDGFSSQKIAELMGTTRQTVNDIVTFRSWRHVIGGESVNV